MQLRPPPAIAYTLCHRGVFRYGLLIVDAAPHDDLARAPPMRSPEMRRGTEQKDALLCAFLCPTSLHPLFLTAYRVFLTTISFSFPVDMPDTPTLTPAKKVILVIGATGAQGSHVINKLLEPSEDGHPSPYAIRALTRDRTHRRARNLETKGVELVEGERVHPTAICTKQFLCQAPSKTSQSSPAPSKAAMAPSSTSTPTPLAQRARSTPRSASTKKPAARRASSTSFGAVWIMGARRGFYSGTEDGLENADRDFCSLGTLTLSMRASSRMRRGS